MSKRKVHVVILAGGHGARFWPLSRMHMPKQFLPLSGSTESLIQCTAKRMQKLVPTENISVVSSEQHAELVREHLPGVRVIVEPMPKNTAAALGLAAAVIEQESPGAVMVAVPSDHAIADADLLISRLKRAVDVASREDALVTLGITASSPNTAYGYIRRGAEAGEGVWNVARFYEKPNLERARGYLESGDYFWNSGMFIWRTDVILAAIKKLMPDLSAGLDKIRAGIGSPNESEIVRHAFAKFESISIDLGVLEHATNCMVVESGPIGWNDVGSWDAWADHFTPDKEGNLLYGNALAIDATSCIVHSPSRMIAVLGCTDLVIVDTEDALLVCNRAQVQDVKKIVDELKRRGKNELV